MERTGIVGDEFIDSGILLEVSVGCQMGSFYKEGLDFYPLLLISIRKN